MSHLEKFQYQIIGHEERPKLVFLHGLMGSLGNWRKITSQLKEEFHILILDQRGHGRSFHPEFGYAPEDYAEDLRLILEELQWKAIHLVGHSMGGRNALAFAGRYENQLHSLVIEDIDPKRHDEAKGRVEYFINNVPTPFRSKEEAKDFFAHDFLQVESVTPTLAQFFYANLEIKKSGEMDWRFSKEGILQSLKLGHKSDFWPVIENLRVPTLFVRGELSEDLSSETLAEVCERNEMIRGVEIPGSGHWVHFDQPKLFTQIIREFFNNFI